MSQIAERRLGPEGLTNAQGLAFLKEYLGQANTVPDLARICAIDPGAMTRLLDRLEKKGLISRTRCSKGSSGCETCTSRKAASLGPGFRFS
jgi:DNA-binding MarR family transcriptional regulator